MTPAISDIVLLPDGFPVVDLKVRVEKVGKPFENEGQQGKWFRQSVLVSDPTGLIEVSRSWDAKDGDPYKLEAGMMVLVSARPSNKGGQLVGVQKTTYTNKKTGVTSPQIRARAGFMTPIQGQTPSGGGSRPTEAPVASAGHSEPSNRTVVDTYGASRAKMTEEEACELLVRNYHRMARSFWGPDPTNYAGPSAQEIAAWSTSVFIAVGQGDVVRDTTAGTASERSSPLPAELERRLTKKEAEEIVLEKARSGGSDPTLPEEPDPWEYGS